MLPDLLCQKGVRHQLDQVVDGVDGGVHGLEPLDLLSCQRCCQRPAAAYSFVFLLYLTWLMSLMFEFKNISPDWWHLH